MPTIATAGTGKAVGKNAALQILAKRLADIGLWGVVVTRVMRVKKSMSLAKTTSECRLPFERHRVEAFQRHKAGTGNEVGNALSLFERHTGITIKKNSSAAISPLSNGILS